MGNILIEQLPEAVEIDGREWAIRTGFRDCLRVILAFEDAELTIFEKQMVLLELLYPEKPNNAQAAFDLGIQFLNGGEPGESDGGGPSMRLYSFAQDAGFIFSAFRQTHGIDLEKAEMHWWKFIALFMDLGPETTFCNLVSLRKKIKTGKASKEERQTYREIRDVAELPELDTRTIEEKAQMNEFLRQVEEAKKRRMASREAK